MCGSLQPLGKITDYFARVEFQNRGSPHLHLFFWIANIPSVHEYDKRPALLAYIDSVVSTKIPPVDVNKTLHDMVSSLQRHRHIPNYCFKSRTCRFGFLFPVRNETRIIEHADMTSSGSCFYETSRGPNDTYINGYNPTILRFWRANMDIKLVSSAESAAFYVCAYLCKAEPDELRLAVSALLQEMMAQETPCPQRVRMLKIGACVLKNRRLSAQEAAYRLGDLQLTFATRTVLSLNTKPPGQRFRVVKPKTERESLPGNSTDIFCPNMIEYYHARPAQLHSLCLYEFAQWYVKCPPPVSLTGRAQPRISLLGKHAGVFMRKRTKFAVIRTPKLPTTFDAYFYSLIMLYYPHTTEGDILKNADNGTVYETAKDSFLQKQACVNLERLGTASLIDEIVENAVRIIHCSRLELACSLIPATSEQEHMFADDSSFVTAPTFCDNIPVPFIDVLHNTAQDTDNFSDEMHLHGLKVCTISVTDLNAIIMQLTSCQKRIMNYVMSHYNKPSQSPLRLFITGGGGVGKSYLTKVIIEWLRLCHSLQSGQDPVVVTAPTGTAACAIKGSTLHSTLVLPVQHGKEPEFLKASAKTLKRLRDVFCRVHTIIIDEISMVSSRLLSYVDRRLREIKDNNEPFGGLNMIVIGDFFQLRPVRGHYAFAIELLWPPFTPFFLDTNVRQSGNASYSALLNRARVGLLTDADISQLPTRLIHPLPFASSSAIHLFPKNKELHLHNDAMQSTLPDCLYEIPAFHYFGHDDLNRNAPVPEDLIPSDDRNAGGYPRMLKLSVGTRIMLLKNIHTKSGLVNGAMGFVSAIECDLQNLTRVLYIYITFDDDDIARNVQSPLPSQGIRLSRDSRDFIIKGRCIVREQFPLQPSWACTIHKVQGASLDRAVISLGNDVFEKGMAYVALSRVRTMDGLFLLALNPSKIQPQSKVIEEYNRLRQLYRQ